jgi:hypothetical protein
LTNAFGRWPWGFLLSTVGAPSMKGAMQMFNVETTAKRLLEFTDAALHQARGQGWQTHVGQPTSSKSAQQQIYEKCAAMLDDAECDALDRIILKMMPAARLPSPPGAIVPQ